MGLGDHLLGLLLIKLVGKSMTDVLRGLKLRYLITLDVFGPCNSSEGSEEAESSNDNGCSWVWVAHQCLPGSSRDQIKGRKAMSMPRAVPPP